MIRILFLCLVLLTGGPILAQETPLTGDWDCHTGGFGPNGGAVCSPSCRGITGDWTRIPSGYWECKPPAPFPDSLKTDRSRCGLWALQVVGTPRCYPPETDFNALLNPAPATPVASSGGDDSSGKENALFAAGGALIGAALVGVFSE